MLHYVIRARGEDKYLAAHWPGAASFVSDRRSALRFDDRERVEGVVRSLAIACDVEVISDEGE